MKASIRKLLKSTARRVPPIRRLHDQLILTNQENAELRSVNGRLHEGIAGLNVRISELSNLHRQKSEDLSHAEAEIRRLSVRSVDGPFAAPAAELENLVLAKAPVATAPAMVEQPPVLPAPRVRNKVAGRGVRRIVLVSTALPPTNSGQARVLGRVLHGQSGMSAILMSDSAELAGFSERDGYGRYVRMRAPRFLLWPKLGAGRVSGHRVNNLLGLMWTILRRSHEISRAAGRHTDVIVGCSGDPFDLGAAYLAAQRLSVPFVAYLFDDPVFQFPPGVYRRLARMLEPLWSRAASAIIAPNEVLAEDLIARQPAVKPIIIRNPIEDAAFRDKQSGAVRTSGAPIRIIYTGSVYHAQGDAFRNLIAAMARAPGRYRLDIYTSQPPSMLEANGVVGPDVQRHNPLEGNAVFDAQRSADILFLPLAFRSSIQDVVRSSAPGKMGEYLTAGVPILAHAPKGSFVSIFFRAHGAGIIVDDDSVDALEQGLVELATNDAVRQRVVGAARRASVEFGQAEAQRRFRDVLNAAVEGVPA